MMANAELGIRVEASADAVWGVLTEPDMENSSPACTLKRSREMASEKEPFSPQH